MVPRFDLARRLDPLKVGIGAACLLVAALGLLPALAMRPFTVIDENAHTSYALEVASGSLPTMRSPTRPLIPGMGLQKTYVANHPPLYYGVAGVPMRLGVAAGKPVIGFLLGRLVTLGFMILAVLAIALLARAALPGRPALAIAASAVVAAVPFIPSTGAQIANDAAALATTAAVLVLSVGVLQEPTRRRIVALSAACVVAALTRGTGLEVAALAAAAVSISVGRRPADGPVGRWRRFAEPVVAALAILLPVLITSGWFYLRNRHLYGDFFGANYALALFPGPHLGLHQTLFAEHFWTGQLRQLLTRPQYVTGVVSSLGRVVLVVLAIGLVALAVRGIMRWRRSRPQPSVTAVLIGVLLAAQVLLSLAAQLQYLSRGGFAYVRYALPAAPVLALVAGAALLAMPLGRRGPFVVLVVGLLSFASVIVLSKGIAFRHPGWERYGILERYRVGLGVNGIPAPSVILTLLLALVVVAIAGLGWSLVRTTRTGVET